MSLSEKDCRISVVVVSDYEAGETKTWADEITMLEKLAAQDIEEPFRILIGESEKARMDGPPSAIGERFPHAQIVYHPSDMSAALKDAALAEVETPLVAVLEADALPEADWLRRLVEAADAYRDFDIFSGRTWYGDETAWARALNLIGRSFDDLGVSGETVHVSNNGALYRTDVLKRFPYPDAGTPFLSSRRRTASMQAAGIRFWFCREARMRHAIGGFSFILDVHRNTGYSDLRMAERQSFGAMAATSRRRMQTELGSAIRVGTEYLKPTDWPLWASLYLFVRFPEWRGMIEARQEKPVLEGSAYR